MSPAPELPDPQTPTERLLYIGVIMGVAAVITIGLAATWAAMVVKGDPSGFPSSLQNAFFAALAFIMGGGIAARVR